MTENGNGNGRVANIIAGATFAFIFFSACAGAFIVPLQDKIATVKEDLKEFKQAYLKYHDDLDNRLQREMRDVNDKTEQKVIALNEKFEKELDLNIKIMEERIKK